MAIYRSDQAQVTFAVEAAPGGSPEMASAVTNNTVPAIAGQIPTAPSLSVVSGGAVNVGTHYYKIVFFNDSTDVESEAGVASAVVTTASSDLTVSLTSIPTGPTGTTQRHIYRTVTGNSITSAYYYVPVASALVDDNTTTTAIDVTSDTGLGATAQIPSSGFLIADATGVPAGSRSISVGEGFAGGEAGDHTGAATASVSHFIVGDHIQIGPLMGFLGGAGTTTRESEVRRVEFIDGTSLVLDRPTAFQHFNECRIQRITAITDTDNDKFITFVPGVYETVEVPDPAMALEPRYYLGTASKRNPYQFLKGQQTFTGSIGGFVLLDGRALRFPIGKVNTTTTFVNTAGTSANPTYGAMINQAMGTKKGDIFVTVNAALDGGVIVGTHLLFTGSVVASTTSTATSEVRKHIGSTSATVLQLDSPLQFDHVDNEFVYAIVTTAGGTTVQTAADTTLIPYAHTISETVDLDSVSWHVHVRDSSETDANDFDRRYYGGKIGNISISAEEGGLLTCGWDGVNFLGMNHNQDSHSGLTGEALPFFTLMQPIRDGDVDAPGTINSSATAEPYYFSQGQVTLFGSVVARVRSFSLSINNNEEPRYYLKRTMGRHRGPSEILEQRREYTCSVTLALPDATTNTSSTINVFKELLLEGDYGSGMQGFNIELRFDRGASDNIILTIPDDGAAGTGGNEQGAFINTAPHTISEANPMEVEAEILFRNLKIEVNDNIAVYP